MKISIVFILTCLTLNTYSQKEIIDGEFKEFYPNEQLKADGFYKNGKADSVWTFYYDNGNIYKTGTYKECTYNLGYIEVLKQAIDFEWHEKGVENGIWKTYHLNGKLKSEYFSICGSKSGLEKKYDDKGYLEMENFYSNGEIQFSKEYYINGKILEYITYSYYDIKESEKHNIRHCKTTTSVFYENGELEELYHDDDYDFHGEYKSFWKNGFLQRQAFYENGDEEGVVKEFYDNGFLESETEYKKGKKHGYEIIYSRTSQIIKKQKWENGELIVENE
jgi:antitoxin component YwqK of YwqJK toxin-antitoxin module